MKIGPLHPIEWLVLAIVVAIIVTLSLALTGVT